MSIAGEVVYVWRQGIYEISLYLTLNFSANPKCSKKIKSIIKRRENWEINILNKNYWKCFVNINGNSIPYDSTPGANGSCL
jgi:hypothetical protein